MSTLTISVDPHNRQELIEASSMLENLAFRLDNAVTIKPNADLDVSDNESSESNTTQIATYTHPNGNSYVRCQLHKSGWKDTQIDALPQGEPVTSVPDTEAPAPIASVASDNNNGGEPDENLDDVHNMSKANDVDLAPATTVDANIPWDSRIHTGKKTKLAKAPHHWTLKRNIEKTSPGLVAQVEKELAAVMSASPEKPIEASTDGPKAPVKPSPKAPGKPTPPAAPKKYLIENVAYTADELKGFDSGWTDDNISDLPLAEPEAAIIETVTDDALTWPQILAKITAAKGAGEIDDAAVTAACNSVGLESIQLAGARPDLHPSIIKALFE